MDSYIGMYFLKITPMTITYAIPLYFINSTKKKRFANSFFKIQLRVLKKGNVFDSSVFISFIESRLNPEFIDFLFFVPCTLIVIS